MSMPEHRTDPEVTTPAPTGGGQLVPRPRVPGPTRTARAVHWTGYHLGELAGVGVPGVLAATVSPWCGLASGLAALLWAVNEYRIRHRDDRGETGQGGDAR